VGVDLDWELIGPKKHSTIKMGEEKGERRHNLDRPYDYERLGGLTSGKKRWDS